MEHNRLLVNLTRDKEQSTIDKEQSARDKEQSTRDKGLGYWDNEPGLGTRY